MTEHSLIHVANFQDLYHLAITVYLNYLVSDTFAYDSSVLLEVYGKATT